VVFSRGYGLEDDEERARDKSFRTVLGAMSNISAFNDAVAGMREGGIRRFAVAPDQGWRKPGKACDGGPGGSGQGGDLKTDYVVVPTATMVATEACFDNSKQPFPLAYAEQRRMAQRFDQSLIMEVELVRVGPGDSSLL
jgi:FKBP-type peptidyl-prolyl cis-trans isomerase